MKPKPHILCIPRELRDNIYRHVFSSAPKPHLDFSNYHDVGERIVTPPLKALPSICAASKLLYFEATPVFLTRVTPISVNIETICWLRKWLATFPLEAGYRAIRRLTFRNFQGPEQIKGFELIELCPNLRSLDVKLGDEYAPASFIPSLTIKSLSSSVNAYESLENIIAMHQLHRFISIPKISRMTFGFHDWYGEPSIDRGRQVKEWLKVKFAAAGKEVRVDCPQLSRRRREEDYDLCMWYYEGWRVDLY